MMNYNGTWVTTAARGLIRNEVLDEADDIYNFEDDEEVEDEEEDDEWEDMFTLQNMKKKKKKKSPKNSKEQNEKGRALHIVGLKPSLNDAEMNHLSEAMASTAVNQRLTTLNLIACVRKDPDVLWDFFQSVLPGHPSLRYLNLAANDLTCAHASWMANALDDNTVLQTLCMSKNIIRREGVEALASALFTNTSLVELDLSENPIQSKGCMAIAEALENDNSNTNNNRNNSRCQLRRLYLADTELAAWGLNALAEALFTNKCLETLWVGDNWMNRWEGDQVCKVFSKTLSVNTTLQRLVLRNVRMTSKGAKQLERALRSMNYSLQECDIGNDNKDEEDQHFLFPLEEQPVTMDLRNRITTLCDANRRITRFYKQLVVAKDPNSSSDNNGSKKKTKSQDKEKKTEVEIRNIPLALWPLVLETLSAKPDLLFSILKAKPEELCRERLNPRRRPSPAFTTSTETASSDASNVAAPEDMRTAAADGFSL